MTSNESKSITLDFDAIEQQIKLGFIEVKQHPNADLRIYNYTQKAQEEWHWTPETIACRGLIVDAQDRIHSRPFEKFFSYDQLEGNVPDEPFEAYEKLDGSLGVMYWTDEGPAVATRGSFTSNQAKRATRILRTRYLEVPWKRDVTYLFEIIYPQNRIVIDYGAMEDIVVLGAIETRTGTELPLSLIESELVAHGVKFVKRYDGLTDFQKLLEQNEENREGFVVRFESGMRVKIKFEEYKRLHKFMLGINPVRIWELLRSGEGTKQLLDQVPDHFTDWVQQTEADLRHRFKAVEMEAKSEMQDFPTRKEFAEYAQSCKHKKILFLMLDGRDYSDVIWKMVRPSVHDAFLDLADDPLPDAKNEVDPTDDYPAAHSGDVEWFATDADGHVAYFNPWDSAPTPKKYSSRLFVDQAVADGVWGREHLWPDGEVASLETAGDVMTVISPAKPGEMIDLRGMFSVFTYHGSLSKGEMDLDTANPQRVHTFLGPC